MPDDDRGGDSSILCGAPEWPGHVWPIADESEGLQIIHPHAFSWLGHADSQITEQVYAHLLTYDADINVLKLGGHVLADSAEGESETIKPS